MTWRAWTIVSERPWLWPCGMCEILHESFTAASERARRSENIVDGIRHLLAHKEVRRGNSKFCDQLLAVIAELERQEP